MNGLRIFHKYAASRRLLHSMAAPRAKLLTQSFVSFIGQADKILDIGAGICDIDELLITRGYAVTPLDVQDLSLNTLKPIIYDGEKLPFDTMAFDTALLITVLHHIENPEQTLREAARVARKMIIIEDVYNSTFRRYITFFMYSMLNLEFIGHSHSNKTHEEWQELFNTMGIQLVATETFSSFIVMQHRLYVLESPRKI